MLVEQLVALSSVVIVGGAILTVLYRLMIGSRRENNEIEKIAAEMKAEGAAKTGKGKKKKG